MLMAHVSYLFLLLWDFACLIYPRIGSSPPWDVPPNHLLLRAGGCLWLVPQIASALLGSILVRCLHAPVCSEVHKWLPESPWSNFLHVLLQPALASTLHTSTRIKHKLVLCVSMTGSCGYGSFRNIYCNRNNLGCMGHCISMAERFQISEHVIPGLVEAIPSLGGRLITNHLAIIDDCYCQRSSCYHCSSCVWHFSHMCGAAIF